MTAGDIAILAGEFLVAFEARQTYARAIPFLLNDGHVGGSEACARAQMKDQFAHGQRATLEVAGRHIDQSFSILDVGDGVVEVGLRMSKLATNRWFENMGLLASCYATADLDTFFHQSPSYVDFFTAVRERGMDAALAERAEKYG